MVSNNKRNVKLHQKYLPNYWESVSINLIPAEYISSYYSDPPAQPESGAALLHRSWQAEAGVVLAVITGTKYNFKTLATLGPVPGCMFYSELRCLSLNVQCISVEPYPILEMHHRDVYCTL